MISSVKGRRMLENVSPIYGQSKIMRAIMEATGTEFDGADQLADEVFAQLFPQTVTWGIAYWEALLKIPSNKELPIEQRRARVLSRMRYRWPMTRERLERIVNQFVIGKTARVVEIPYEYAFRIEIPAEDIDWYFPMLKTVHEIKPAHLEFIPRLLIEIIIKIAHKHSTLVSINSRNNFWAPYNTNPFFDGAINFDGTYLFSGNRYGPWHIIQMRQKMFNMSVNRTSNLTKVAVAGK